MTLGCSSKRLFLIAQLVKSFLSLIPTKTFRTQLSIFNEHPRMIGTYQELKGNIVLSDLVARLSRVVAFHVGAQFFGLVACFAQAFHSGA